MYEIKSAGLKGLGVFASRPIPRGTRIFSEKPLLSIRPGQGAGEIYSSFRGQGEAERKRFLGLSSHLTGELRILRWSQAFWFTVASIFRKVGMGWNLNLKQHVRILSIFRNNAFALSHSSGYAQAVFPRISRINHSCLPNAQGNFHAGMGRFNVHATRDIGVGEEVMINYLQEHGAGREKRTGLLRGGYGFECGCPACDFSEEARRGEERRVKVQEELVRYVEGVKGGSVAVERELEAVMRFVMLLEGEGIAGRELSTLYLEAAKLNEKYGKLEDALRCAERALEIDGDCLGVDHPLYEESQDIVRKYESLIGRELCIEDEENLAMKNR